MLTDYEDRISLEDWADEILKRRDEFDEIRVFPTTNFQAAIENAKNRLSRNLIEQEKNTETDNPSHTHIMAHLITDITRYLIDLAQYQDNKDDLVNALRFYKLAKKTYLGTNSKSYSALTEGEDIGIFIMALKLNGSSVLQAKKAVAKWTKSSKTKVESSYTKIDKKNISDWEDYLWMNNIEIANVFLRNIENTFPPPQNKIKNSPERKTYNAFVKVKSDLIEFFKDEEFYAAMPLRPLQVGIDWKKFEDFRKKIITLD